MRILPFLKPSNKVDTCGVGFDGGGGGSQYELPTATANRLGGVKIGTGVNVAEDGTISVEASGGGGIEIGTTETKIGKYGTKDLYCKSYSGSITPNYELMNIGANRDVIAINGVLKYSNMIVTMGLYDCGFTINTNGQVVCSVVPSGWSNVTGHITVLYTKD